MKDENYSRHLEWESFAYPLAASNPKSLNEFHKMPSNSIITVWRDHEYKLRGEINAETNDPDIFKFIDSNKKSKKGNFIKGETIRATNPSQTINYKFSNCYIHHISSRPLNNDQKIIHTSASINLDGFTESYSDKEASRLSEWYLIGKINLRFPRKTERSLEEIRGKFRDVIDKNKGPKKITFNKCSGSSYDHFLIDTENIKCIVQLSPKFFLPDWGNGIAIEFRKEFGIPKEDTRQAIAELVGFIIGTQLLKIGSTEYDEQERILRKIANDPWGDNVIAKCDTHALPPINYPNVQGRHLIENVINEVLPNYLKLRNPLNLSSILWKYWIARDLAIGTNLPVLSSALESLAEMYLGYLGHQKKVSEAEKSDYKKLVESELKSLEINLKNFALKENILNKLRNPFQLSVTDKLKMFFKTLSFEFDNKSVENRALKSRNIMAHSTLETNEENVVDIVRLTRAYESLFNRTLLKIMSFNGKYIDYYSLGHFERDLCENIKE